MALDLEQMKPDNQWISVCVCVCYMYARSHVSAPIYVCVLHAHVCTRLGEQADVGVSRS